MVILKSVLTLERSLKNRETFKNFLHFLSEVAMLTELCDATLILADK